MHPRGLHARRSSHPLVDILGAELVNDLLDVLLDVALDAVPDVQAVDLGSVAAQTKDTEDPVKSANCRWRVSGRSIHKRHQQHVLHDVKLLDHHSKAAVKTCSMRDYDKTSQGD